MWILEHAFCRSSKLRREGEKRGERGEGRGGEKGEKERGRKEGKGREREGGMDGILTTLNSRIFWNPLLFF